MAYTVKFVFLSLALAAPAAAGAAPKKSAQEQKYCIQYEQDTGSRINRIECKTKAEWSKLGVNVDELTKR